MIFQYYSSESTFFNPSFFIQLFFHLFIPETYISQWYLEYIFGLTGIRPCHIQQYTIINWKTEKWIYILLKIQSNITTTNSMWNQHCNNLLNDCSTPIFNLPQDSTKKLVSPLICKPDVKLYSNESFHLIGITQGASKQRSIPRYSTQDFRVHQNQMIRAV